LAPLAPAAGGATALAAALGSAVALVAIGARARPAAAWLVLVGLLAALAGLLLGALRLRAIDGGAYRGRVGSHAELSGYVAAVPRRSHGEVRVQVAGTGGRLLVETDEPVPDLRVGAEVRASGAVLAAPPWYAPYLRRQGIVQILRTGRLQLTGRRRGGLAGRIDLLRARSEAALGRGVPAAEAALARGFVLGQDDRIDPVTIEQFRRSGLAHLLAVSGQNVLLLALLASPVLAALGIPLRARLLWLLALIAVYVPLAGGSPSIQRAAAMGAAAIVATLAGRPQSRAYALLLAVAGTLALNPRASGDAGWQLSFAAVLGILVWARPLRELVERRLGCGTWQRGLADGAAVTAAATLATAPLMAAHFGSLSLTSLLANLLALPAVAPAMWLGMLVAAGGQIPGLPVEPLNWVNSLLLAYIEQVAAWMAAPRWAQPSLRAPGAAAVAAAYALLISAGWWARRRIESRVGLSPRRGARRLRVPRAAVLALAAALAAWLVLGSGPKGANLPGRPELGLRLSVLDVGQGDSILLQPSDGEPILVDGGPPGDALWAKLAEEGVTELAAAVLTHDQADHAGGIGEILGAFPIGRLVYAQAGQRLLRAATAAQAIPTRVAEGSELRSGGLRLEVLWPPRELLATPPEDSNLGSVVLLARWRNFEMLLTGDAEAEAVPLEPGPLDVLKIAHHGSADAGLDALLDRTAPGLAVISVGEGNPFGHPDPLVLRSLRKHGVRILRTDRSGTIELAVVDDRLRLWTRD
jgi:competence protein ComEC